MRALRGTLKLAYIDSIHVRFCPWDARASTTREFLRRVTIERNNNPSIKTVIKRDMTRTLEEPLITLQFVDGAKMTLRPAVLRFNEFMVEIVEKLTVLRMNDVSVLDVD